MASRRVNFGPRHHLTPQQRQRLLARYHRSRLSQRDFAAREGVGLSTLVKWLRDECRTEPAAVAFQEVMVPNTSGRWALEVVSPQGWTVRLAQTSDLPDLARLLAALPC